MIIEVTDVYSGYCHQCHGPETVGQISVFSQKYRFNICESCVGELLKKIRSGVIKDNVPTSF